MSCIVSYYLISGHGYRDIDSIQYYELYGFTGWLEATAFHLGRRMYTYTVSCGVPPGHQQERIYGIFLPAFDWLWLLWVYMHACHVVNIIIMII